MKKFISVISLLVLVALVSFVLVGCGAEDEEITTTIPSTTRDTVTNEGMVTDSSEKGDNGAIGDAITDVSEGLSDLATDISEDMTKR